MCMRCEESNKQWRSLCEEPVRGYSIGDRIGELARDARLAGLIECAGELESLSRGLCVEAAQAQDSVECLVCGQRFHVCWSNHFNPLTNRPCEGHRTS